MSQVTTVSRQDRVAPTKITPGRACSNNALTSDFRYVSPSGAPFRAPRCDRARIKTVQPDLPRVSGASALLTAMLLVAIAFGVLLLGSWRQSSVSGASGLQEAAPHAARLVAQAHGADGPGGE